MGYIGHWADLSAPAFATLDRKAAVAILPIGAVEQHGPHLAMSVDRDLTLAVLTRALRLTDPSLTVLALPVQARRLALQLQAPLLKVASPVGSGRTSGSGAAATSAVAAPAAASSSAGSSAGRLSQPNCSCTE